MTARGTDQHTAIKYTVGGVAGNQHSQLSLTVPTPVSEIERN